MAKQALLIASAGRHNILLVGPPGEGKSMLVGTMPGYQPPTQYREEQEIGRIYSHQSIPVGRPLRTVSPTITVSTLIGGGQVVTPGEISLAHAGILFMDELPQYPKAMIDKLRAPLEDNEVTITRAGSSVTYPCDFQLVAAMNPCPCGYLGSPECSCSDYDIRRYQSKLSGPILDRIDLAVEVGRTEGEEKFALPIANQTAMYRRKVIRAYHVQIARQGCFNCNIPGHELFSKGASFNCQERTIDYLKELADEECYSTRKLVRLARVGRTVADLLGKHKLTPSSIKIANKFITNPLLS